MAAARFQPWHDARVPTAKKPALKEPSPKQGNGQSPRSGASSGASPKRSKAKPAARADFGAPIEGFFEKQPAELREILLALRALIDAAAPSASASLKWGMPFYELDKKTLCALGGHKAHVNLILSGPPGTFSDPKGLLVGDGKTGRHLRLTRLADLPTTDVKRWLREAVAQAKR